MTNAGIAGSYYKSLPRIVGVKTFFKNWIKLQKEHNHITSQAEHIAHVARQQALFSVWRKNLTGESMFLHTGGRAQPNWGEVGRRMEGETSEWTLGGKEDMTAGHIGKEEFLNHTHWSRSQVQVMINVCRSRRGVSARIDLSCCFISQIIQQQLAKINKQTTADSWGLKSKIVPASRKREKGGGESDRSGAGKIWHHWLEAFGSC